MSHIISQSWLTICLLQRNLIQAEIINRSVINMIFNKVIDYAKECDFWANLRMQL